MPVTVTMAHGPERYPDRDVESARVTATAETYAEARDDARSQIPDGHFVYWLDRD
ncbi:hypothetical protein [Nocardioides sp. ChNu-99]|uniref:hypothetical protein n=1 Tax=Nocardioides sp. ChNu-99 TaxID=2839897 RepID=UPI00240598C1|nr:hypothetical protein [Nocardioides sp. ChNu-99]MDF9716049.1 hypothetical protein [Nocardioides sp. ChNu-99]